MQLVLFFSCINKTYVSFTRFLFGLSVRHVGEETARDVAEEFGSFAVLWKYLLDLHGNK